MAILTILSAITGFVGSALPEAIGYFNKKREDKQTLAMLDKELALQEQTNLHELVVMDKQAEITLQEHSLKIEEIDVSSSNNYDLGLLDIQKEETKKDDFIGKLVRSVRPVTTFLFLSAYIAMKVTLACYLWTHGAAIPAFIAGVWSEIDMSIFVMILSYYFGQRTIQKAMDKNKAI